MFLPVVFQRAVHFSSCNCNLVDEKVPVESHLNCVPCVISKWKLNLTIVFPFFALSSHQIVQLEVTIKDRCVDHKNIHQNIISVPLCRARYHVHDRSVQPNLVKQSKKYVTSGRNYSSYIEMVAELTGIPVPASALGRSTRNKPSRILGCNTSCSTSSSSSTVGKRYEGDSAGRSRDRKRPRWIRAATREPIYSVLDDREKPGCFNRTAASPSRANGRGKTFEYEISAVRNGNSSLDRDPPPIYRRNSELIGSNELREDEEESEEESEEEHALYSVVRKVPKNVFGLELAKLTILKEEEAQDSREEVLKKQRELQKWLHSSSGQGGDSKRESKVLKGRNSKMDAEKTMEEKGKGREEMESRKVEDHSWNSPGVSIPRGVAGMVGPFCRIYRNPNERREVMLKEEVQERGIDVGGAGDAEENLRMEDEFEEEAVTAVDSVSESTFVGESNKKMKMRDYEVDDDSVVVEQQQYRRRAKWRIFEEGEERKECVVKKIDKEEEDDKKSMKNRKWSKDDDNDDDNGHLGHIGMKEMYDLEIPPKYTSRRSETSNEPHDKDSLNETGSTTGGTVEGNHSGSPARGERSSGSNEPVASTGDRRPIATTVPPRSLVSRILARARSSDDLLDHSEPYSQLWIVLSNVYGELVVVLMMALCLAEVMDTPVPLLSLQSIYLMYLYVGSIAVIISIYLWVLVDSCGSLGNGNSGNEDAELGGRASLTRFGSLKRAHISRARTAPTSFYIRVGALLFGLATLVFNGLEMAMHSMMQGAECLSDVVFVHPVLHGLFTFLQMHFLFVNSQVLVERFGLAARFGFTHLAATNIAVWVRLVIWDSAQEWTYFVHLAQRGPETSSSPLNLRGFPGSLTRKTRDLLSKASPENVVLHPYQPISNEQISQVVTLQECLNTNTLGQLWTSSMPFLYPFIVQFSLIAAAVMYVMGQNVGRNRYCHKQKFHSSKDLTSHMRVGCDASSKGLFLGILCMTAGIVVILIFLVVREDENFSPATLSWLTCGTLIGILALSGIMTATGLVQVRQMSVVSRAPAALDGILSNAALFGVQLYSVFTAVVCACSLATFDEETENADSQGRHAMLLAASVLQLVQCFAQSTLIAETSKRSCITRFQMMAKPARQVITFLLFSNAVLWAFDTVVTQNWVSQELQLRFFGVLAWGILSRICLPLVVFYRFHSCVLLLEAWNKCYRTPRGEHPLN